MPKRNTEKKRQKLLEVLKSFSNSELTGLKKFLDSPFFHHTPDVVRLFVQLRKYHPAYPPKKVDDRALGAVLFPGVENGWRKVKNFRTDLFKLVEKFLIIKQLDNEELQKTRVLALAYCDHNLPRLYQRELEKSEHILEASKSRGLNHCLNRLQLAHLYYFNADTHKFLENKELLSNLMQRLDAYFATAKIQYAYEMLERSEKFNETFEIALLYEAEMIAKKQRLSDENPALKIYQQLAQLQKGAINRGLFGQIQTTFFSNLPNLAPEDRQAIFKYMVNYTIKAIAGGATDFMHLQLELYKTGIEKELLLNRGRMTTTTFINIALMASRLKDFDWLDHFITTQSTYLNPFEMENTKRLAKAISFFHRGHFEQVLDLLHEVEFESHDIHLACTSLTIKSLFELFLQDDSFYEPILHRLRSLERWVSKDSGFSGAKRKTYQTYFQMLRRMLKARLSPKTTLLFMENLKSEIQNSSEIVSKNWLLEKTDQLIQLKTGKGL